MKINVHNFSISGKPLRNGGVGTMLAFSSIDGVLVFLWSITHAKHAVKPECMIYGTIPAPQGSEYIAPKTYFLSEDVVILNNRNIADVIAQGKKLVKEHKISHIGIIIGLNRDDNIRFSAQFFWNEQIKEAASGDYVVLCNVNGATRDTNERLLKMTVNEAVMFMQAYFDKPPKQNIGEK